MKTRSSHFGAFLISSFQDTVIYNAWNHGFALFLQQAAGTLPDLKQSPLLSAVVKPLNDSLVKHSLLRHKDKDVKLLVAMCFCEIIRILAPNPDFSDELLRVIIFNNSYFLWPHLYPWIRNTCLQELES